MVNATRFDVATLQTFTADLEDLSRDRALAVVDDALDHGATLEAVVNGLLAPALVDLGRRWAAAEMGAAEVQAASAIARVALLRAGHPLPPSDLPRVAVCCPEGEAHQIPAEMVVEVLRSRGWPAELAGHGVSGDELRTYLGGRPPAALLVSCTMPSRLAGVARAIDAAHEVGVPTMVGGAGLGRDDTRALRLGAAAWAPSVRAGARLLDEWVGAPPQLPPGRALTEDYLTFEAALPDVRAQSLDALRRSNLRRHDDLSAVGPADERLDLLLQHLGAALLVDDRLILQDFVSWRVAYLKARHESVGGLAATLEGVAGALPDAPDRARCFLDGALEQLPKADRRLAIVRPPAPPAPAGSPPAEEPPASVRSLAGPDMQQGQVFADLLFLAAMSCHAPMALISVAQPDGQWSTLSYGVDRREALSDPALFARVAAQAEPLEVRDLPRHAELASSPLVSGPLAVRYLYALALRSRQDATLGVFCVLDRRSRELARGEEQALQVIARQVAGQLALWRRSAGAGTIIPFNHPADRRRQPERPGPDAALVELLGLRRTDLAVDQHMLRSHEVAVLFDVTERTITNWAASNKLPSWRTAGGHLRFRTEDVLNLLAKTSGTGGEGA